MTTPTYAICITKSANNRITSAYLTQDSDPIINGQRKASDVITLSLISLDYRWQYLLCHPFSKSFKHLRRIFLKAKTATVTDLRHRYNDNALKSIKRQDAIYLMPSGVSWKLSYRSDLGFNRPWYFLFCSLIFKRCSFECYFLKEDYNRKGIKKL